MNYINYNKKIKNTTKMCQAHLVDLKISCEKDQEIIVGGLECSRHW